MALESSAVEIIRNYQVPIFILVSIIIVATILLEKFGDRLEREVPSFLGDYEKESLKEMFDASVRNVVKNRGRKVNTPFYEGKYEQGFVYKEIKRTEADEPIKISVKRGSSGGEETEDLKEIRIQLIGNKSSKASRISSRFKNSFRSAIGKSDDRDIQILSEDLIKHEDSDRIILKNNIDWTYDPDLQSWFAMGTAENNVKKRVIMDKTLNKMLEEFPNYVEKANNVNPAHTMSREIEKAKKKDEDDPGV